MPYDIRRNYRGKSGYSVVGPDGAVHGTHPSRNAAMQQQRALYAAENESKKIWGGRIVPTLSDNNPETD